jgi:hypothetical protein
VPTKAIQALAGGPGAPPTAFNDGTGAAVSSGAILGENQAVRRLECAKVCATENILYRARATLCVPTKAIQALVGGPGAPPTAFNDGTGAAVSSASLFGQNHPPNSQYIARITVSATNQNSFRAHGA